MFSRTVKAWAAGASSGIGSLLIQWLSAPEVQATLADWSAMLINSAIIALITWIGTWASPKNAT